jgi:hypothetical protein
MIRLCLLVSACDNSTCYLPQSIAGDTGESNKQPKSELVIPQTS